MKPTLAISVLVAAAGTASAQFVTSITPAVAARNGDDGGVLDRRQGAVTTVLRTITKTSTRQSTSTVPLAESPASSSPGSSTASAVDKPITTAATQINTDSSSSSITSSSPTLTGSSNTLTTSSSTETTAASTRVPEPQTGGGGDKISSGTAAGIAAGVVGGVLALVGVFMIAYHKRQKVQNGTVVTADYPHSLGDQKPPMGGIPSRSNTDMFFPPPAARYPVASRSNTDKFFPPPAALPAHPAPARNDADSGGRGGGGSEMTLGANDLAYDTERSGQDAGYSPQSGHEMGYSPRGGQEAGYSPRSGQEMAQSPRGDQEMGYSPRGGQEMGYSPRGGQDIVSSPRSGQDMGYSPRGGGQDTGYSPRSGPVASPGYQNHHAVSTDVPMPAANPASNASGQAVAYPPKGDNFSLPAFMIPGGERTRSTSFGSPEADPSSSPPPPVPQVGRALATGNESPLERNEVELP